MSEWGRWYSKSIMQGPAAISTSFAILGPKPFRVLIDTKIGSRILGLMAYCGMPSIKH